MELDSLSPIPPGNPTQYTRYASTGATPNTVHTGHRIRRRHKSATTWQGTLNPNVNTNQIVNKPTRGSV
jgi:hypothetical protein